MPATRLSEEFRPLCYEHHSEMRLNESHLNGDQGTKQTLVHACLEPNCLVHYSASRGYFIQSHNGRMNEMDKIPSVPCFQDGMPMYLAEIDEERRAFRLWKCPQCGGRHTNEESLVGAASQKLRRPAARPETSGTA
jgi:hypothetical protein